jgi:DNA-nicking Smr family endonuclease
MKYMKKRNKAFNPVFKDIHTIAWRPGKDEKIDKVKKPERLDSGHDDAVHFLEAMSGVNPLLADGKERIPVQGRNMSPSHTPPDEEKKVMTHLRNLIKGSAEMDIFFSDEYIEGSIGGVGKNIMRRFRKGQVPIQDYIDLHGLTQKDAERRVRKFLINSHGRGLRCVLIVHGRGLNSPDNIPVLKERLPVWLNRGPARKLVLAFATARPYDGGTGAIYVLLRGYKAQGLNNKTL